MVEYRKLYNDLDYTFNDEKLLQQALTHRSVGKINNERLEYLGDSILNFVIAAKLYDAFEKAEEGDLSRIRSFLVKGDRLTEIANSIQLGGMLQLGPGELKTGGFRRASILEDAIEAIFGAIYLDGGFDSARQVILNLYETPLKNLPPLEKLKDPKTKLQEYLQAKKLPLPEYTIEEILGEQHNRSFKVACRVPGLDKPTFGIAQSRRKAEQVSAENALSELNNGR